MEAHKVWLSSHQGICLCSNILGTTYRTIKLIGWVASSAGVPSTSCQRQFYSKKDAMQAVLIVSPPTMAWLDINALEALKTSDMKEYKKNMTKVAFLLV